MQVTFNLKRKSYILCDPGLFKFVLNLSFPENNVYLLYNLRYADKKSTKIDIQYICEKWWFLAKYVDCMAE